MYVCVHVHVCHCTHVKIRRQLVGFGSFFLSCMVQESNWGHWFRQALLVSEPSFRLHTWGLVCSGDQLRMPVLCSEKGLESAWTINARLPLAPSEGDGKQWESEQWEYSGRAIPRCPEQGCVKVGMSMVLDTHIGRDVGCITSWFLWPHWCP